MAVDNQQRTLGHSPMITLRATQENIDLGVERNSNHCVVADALRSAYPNLKFISVDIQTIRATDKAKGERYVWITPRRIQKFIIDFDRGDKSNLKPFVTTLKVGQTIPSGRSETDKKKRRASQVRLRARRKYGSSLPVPSGGKAPPLGVGARRQFGLRGLDY